MIGLLKKTIFVVLIVSVCLPVTSGIAFAENPNKLILEEEFLSPNIYKKNGETIPWSEAKEFLRSDPEAAAELDKANTFKVLGVVTEIGMCVLIISRLGYYTIHNSSIDSTGKEQFLLGIIGVTTLAIIFQFQADSYFRKAFNVYNSKLEAKNKLSIKGLLVGKNNIGIVCAF